MRTTCSIACGWLSVGILLAGSVVLAPHQVAAQDRDTKVRNDRANFAETDTWTYNDFETAKAEARRDNKPLLVVLRCIP